MKPSHANTPAFRANREFTGRDEDQDLFRKAVKAGVAPDQYKVLMWYGVGGQGKSELFRQFQRLLKPMSEALVNLPRGRKIVWAGLDFDTPRFRRAEEALRSIRSQLGRQGFLSFHTFDAAFCLYQLKTDPRIDVRQKYPELFRGENQAIEDLLSLAGDAADTLPGVNIVYKWGARLTGRLRTWWNQRGRRLLQGIDSLTAEEIIALLPTYLGSDVCDAIKNDDALSPVIMLDTYEALWSDSARADGLSDPRRDEWVRRLVQDTPGGLFAIFGRDKLRWADLNEEWDEVVQSEPLGGLSDTDAHSFLENVPIDTKAIRNAIIEGAKGEDSEGCLPFYLNLQVDLFERLKQQGKMPVARQFGGTHNKVLNRFLAHLSESELGALRLTSYLQIIAQNSLGALIDTFPGRVANFQWPQLISRSFFSDGDSEGEVVLHDLMRQELQRREQAEDPDHFERVHRYLFQEWESRIAPENGLPPTSENEQACLIAFQHLTAFDAKAAASWALLHSRPFIDKARWRFAESLLRNSYRIAAHELGEDHPSTLATRHGIALQMSEQGRHKEAEVEFRAIWEIKRRPDVLGEDHPSTLSTHHGIAVQMGQQGRHKEAEAEFRAIWEIERRPDVLGEDHPSTLATRHGIAVQMGQQGRHADAEAEFRAIWEIKRRPDVLGEDHPSTLATRHGIAVQMSEQGRHADAEAEFRAIWEIKRRPDVLGEDHPDTLATRHGIAFQMGQQGRHADAEAEFRAIWEIKRRPDVLGEDHPDTLATRHGIAVQMGQQGRHKEAEAEFRAIWEIQRRPDVLGEDHPSTLATRHGIAFLMSEQGRHKEAEAEFRAIWEIKRRPDVLGEDHPSTLITRFCLAQMLDRLGRLDEASELLTGMRKAYLKSLPEGHARIQALDGYLKFRQSSQGPNN